MLLLFLKLFLLQEAISLAGKNHAIGSTDVLQLLVVGEGLINLSEVILNFDISLRDHLDLIEVVAVVTITGATFAIGLRLHLHLIELLVHFVHGGSVVLSSVIGRSLHLNILFVGHTATRISTLLHRPVVSGHPNADVRVLLVLLSVYIGHAVVNDCAMGCSLQFFLTLAIRFLFPLQHPLL